MKIFNYSTLSIENQRRYMPKWLTNRAIGLYFLLLFVVSMAFFSYAMEWYFMLMGIVEVVAFFYCANFLSKSWCMLNSRTHFVKRLFSTALVIRVIYVLWAYWFYYEMTGGHFDFYPADVLFYNSMGQYGHTLLSDGVFPSFSLMNKYAGGLQFGDYGYPLYLSFVYAITGDSLLLTRILKCFLSAWTVVMMYRIASRNFGEKTARIVGIMCMLMPNLIYYCGVHLKETEMVFLTVAAIDQADQLLRARSFNIWRTLPFVFFVGAVCLFRTVLGVVVVLALFTALVLTSGRIATIGKRILIGLLALSLLGAVVGNKVMEEVNFLVEQASDTSVQQKNYEWRSVRADGANSLAKYAGAAVFAPLIFTIPFPTMVETPGQEALRMIHGGNFVKNITSGFTVLAVLMLLLSGDWRKYVLLLAFMMGYLVVLIFSNYAQSERFHMPVLCFELMFAAYAICQCGKRERRWFDYWLIFVFVANIGWAWFKLRGRGLA